MSEEPPLDSYSTALYKVARIQSSEEPCKDASKLHAKKQNATLPTDDSSVFHVNVRSTSNCLIDVNSLDDTAVTSALSVDHQIIDRKFAVTRVSANLTCNSGSVNV